MTQKEASRLTNLSIRQVNRKALRYKKYGYAGLIHQSRGKRSNHAIDEDIKLKILELLRGKYPGYGPTVERLFRTLQDWLPKELKLRGIKTLSAANKFLQNIFINYANKKLVVEPKSDVNLHQSIEDYDLNSLFCLKYNRTLNNDNTIVYKNRFFLLAKKQPIILYKNEKITVNVNFDKTIVLIARGYRLDYKEIEKRPKSEKRTKEKARKIFVYQKPPLNHPWRTYLFNGVKSDISKKLQHAFIELSKKNSCSKLI